MGPSNTVASLKIRRSAGSKPDNIDALSSFNTYQWLSSRNKIYVVNIA